MKDRRLLGFACVAILLSSPALLADSILLNGGFETGSLSGWSTVGHTAAINSSFGLVPMGGAFQALLTNGLGSGAEFPLDEMIRLLNVPFASLRSFSETLIPDGGGVPFSGSAVAQSFVANAGDIITFDWNYLTDEPGSAGGLPADLVLPDIGFVVIDGELILLGYSPLATLDSDSSFTFETGRRSFSRTLSTDGSHYVAFGILNTFDGLVDSALLIDNVAVTAVPIPSTLILLASGLAMLLSRKRKRGHEEGEAAPGDNRTIGV